MTHEELIERVAAEIISESDDWRYKFTQLPDHIKDNYKNQAREAIRITGEACAESLRVIADNANNKSASTTIGAANITIQSLTQGTKE